MTSRPGSYAVAADSPLTAEAAVAVARDGGNVVDMAVAAGLAATITEVLMCSLGGSAFLAIRLPGARPLFIDGADTMPHVAHAPEEGGPGWRRVFLAYGDGIEVAAGHASVAVPGMLAALELASRRFGRMPWRDVVAPALALARTSCPTGPPLARWLAIAGRAVFHEQEASRRCFFPDGETVLGEGDPYQLPHMAETLELIAREGARALYEGELGAAFAREMEACGGYVTRADLAAYRAELRSPVTVRSCGFELALNPPPAVGGAAVGSLVGLLEAEWARAGSAAERALLHARAQQCLLGLRERVLHAPGFGPAEYSRLVEPDTLRDHLGALRSPNTTHLSVATGDGGLVALTMSNGYGSGITIPGTGIVCNNSLGEPELNPGGFHVAPTGTRMVSNMAPTVALHGDGRALALGSPGASRITTAVAQTWASLAFEGRAFADAVAAPRLHVEAWDDGLRVQCEPGIDVGRLAPTYDVRAFEQRDMFFGAVKLAGLDAAGELHAVADDRREGATRIAR